jgi:NAD(P)-dependent dehydrogenase (short-subunit alcohol dehydrogenase family)
VDGKLGNSNLVVTANVGDEDSVAALQELLLDRIGRVDILMSNAASCRRWTM